MTVGLSDSFGWGGRSIELMYRRVHPIRELVSEAHKFSDGLIMQGSW